MKIEEGPNSFEMQESQELVYSPKQAAWHARAKTGMIGFDNGIICISLYTIVSFEKTKKCCYPEVCVLEVASIVLDNVRTVTLLHDRDFFDDFL